MNANELRIGNLVKIHNDLLPETNREIYSVYGINERYDKEFPESKNVVSLRHKSRNARFIRTYSQFDEFIEPIPLTDEWLVKFGLDQGGYDFYFWTKETPTGLFSINGDPESGYGVRYNNEIEPPLEYVHQLQNLYFALTGEELTISE